MSVLVTYDCWGTYGKTTRIVRKEEDSVNQDQLFTSNQYGYVRCCCPVPVSLRKDIIPHHSQGIRGKCGPWELIRYGIQGIHDGIPSSIGVKLQKSTFHIFFHATGQHL